MSPTIQQLIHLIAQTIYDKQGFNILGLDVREVSSMTDYLIIAEGNVDRHLSSIAKSIVKKALEIGENPLMLEGEKEGEWIVIDFGDLMVHLFLEDYREKYELEKMWNNSTIVELDIKTHQPSQKKDSHASS